MKYTHGLTLAAAFAAAAAAYGVHLSMRPEIAAEPEPQTPSPHSTIPRARHRTASAPRIAQNLPSRTDSPQRESISSIDPTHTPIRSVTGTPTKIPGQVLSESQWRERAQQVETAANHELRRLSSLLDLDPVQQDQIFSSLVRQSPNWLPGMTAAPTTSAGYSADTRPASPSSAAEASPTVATDFTAYLNPEQQEELINEEMDRQAWWAEVLPQLLPPALTDVGTVSNTGDPAVESAAPAAVKEFDGSATLLEE